MDFVMINQLPELAIARKRIPPQNNTMTVTTQEKRNPYISKWHALFDSGNEQWISFQPRIGLVAYPCFSCRDMFANRNSFLDHINRRGMILTYFCSRCDKDMTFYNTCSFLLHIRSHFTEFGGFINLENIDITTISMDVAGFMPHPDYPRIFEVEETAPQYNLNINVKFYKAKEECLGHKIVTFEPNELIFYCTIPNSEGIGETHSMMLCQICKDIPKCEFIPVAKPNTQKNQITIQDNIVNDNNNIVADKINSNQNIILPIDTQTTKTSMDVDSDDDDIISVHTVPDEIICLDDSSDEDVREIPEVDVLGERPIENIQLKNLKDLLETNLTSSSNFDEEPPKKSMKLDKLLPRCPECSEEQRGPMKDHFQINEKPNNDHIKCSKCTLILPSPCSLSAHLRIHDRKTPFVCPECGKDFDMWHLLLSHMENLCFHLAKHMRFKCPAKKCGKIFAQTITFSSHVPLQHIAARFTCDICAETFNSPPEFTEHSKIHTFTEALSVTSYECLICSAFFDTLDEHVKVHCLDRDNRIYVYTCKFCRSYYRSKNTYAAHLLRCAKLLLSTQDKKDIVDRNDMKCKIVRYCKKCNSKIQFHCTYRDIKMLSKSCPQCNNDFSIVSLDEIKLKEKSDEIIQKNFYTDNTCVLCDTQIETKSKHFCKYHNPVVVLSKLPLNSHIDSSPESSINGDGVNQKKKRYPPQKKIPINDHSYDMPPIRPIIFNGEYICNICEYKDESRIQFHEHIQRHRDISTAYQCMECGECFVVKPSLIKHLQVIHLIENVDLYINENECYDKKAVRELQEHMRMIPGETKEPVAENQCNICRQIFTDKLELSKHFRVHGMAFLMKNINK